LGRVELADFTCKKGEKKKSKLKPPPRGGGELSFVFFKKKRARVAGRNWLEGRGVSKKAAPPMEEGGPATTKQRRRYSCRPSRAWGKGDLGDRQHKKSGFCSAENGGSTKRFSRNPERGKDSIDPAEREGEGGRVGEKNSQLRGRELQRTLLQRKRGASTPDRQNFLARGGKHNNLLLILGGKPDRGAIGHPRRGERGKMGIKFSGGRTLM